ncbi:MAG: hypothetical protein ACK53Y_23250, partial [bacterium]
ELPKFTNIFIYRTSKQNNKLIFTKIQISSIILSPSLSALAAHIGICSTQGGQLDTAQVLCNCTS